MSQRQICIHGHFYQPPRENPWLEAIEQQDAAYPYHDWNERINAESYGPNGRARILDAHGRITQIFNNYASISFDFGPTLLGWLEEHAAETYAAVLEADRIAVERFGGHGSAMAQAYNHIIMPLANERDRRAGPLPGSHPGAGCNTWLGPMPLKARRRRLESGLAHLIRRRRSRGQ